MIENIIKKMLRKWLKKKLYTSGDKLSLNIDRFNWVFGSPLHKWKGRIWVVKNNPYASKDFCKQVYKEYLNK